MTPGEIVRRAREARGISQHRLAIRAGTTQTAISRLENGDVSPRVETLERLLLVMGYRLDVSAAPMAGILDDRHHDEALRLSVAQRLAEAIGWNEFASELAYAVPRAKAAAASPELGKGPRGEDNEGSPVPSVPVSRPLEAFAALASHDVDYVVIGGFAMQGYGHLRSTVDLDLVLAPEAENLSRAVAALVELRARVDTVDGPRLGNAEHNWALTDGASLTLATTAGHLNVWSNTAGLPGARPWWKLRAAAQTTRVGAIPVTIASADDLLAMTRASATNRRGTVDRLQDLGDIAALTRADNPAAGEIVGYEPRCGVERTPADAPADYGPHADR